MVIDINKLPEYSKETKRRMLTYALAEFKKVEFFFNEKPLTDKSFSDQDRKKLIDTTINALLQSSDVEFLEEKKILSEGESKIYHALGYSTDKVDKTLDESTDEVADVNKKFLEYVKVRTNIDVEERKKMNEAYEGLMTSLKNEDYKLDDKDKVEINVMVDHSKVINNTKGSTRSGMIRQIFFSLTLAAIVRKVIRFKGYSK